MSYAIGLLRQVPTAASTSTRKEMQQKHVHSTTPVRVNSVLSTSRQSYLAGPTKYLAFQECSRLENQRTPCCCNQFVRRMRLLRAPAGETVVSIRTDKTTSGRSSLCSTVASQPQITMSSVTLRTSRFAESKCPFAAMPSVLDVSNDCSRFTSKEYHSEPTPLRAKEEITEIAC
jgi:hypothetical protein